MTDIAQLLDRIVPPYEGTGDWDRVLRDAGLGGGLAACRCGWRPLSRSSPRSGVVALWPSGTGSAVLDRALAATGEETGAPPRLRERLPMTLVDLETGERTGVRAEQEVWFDPEAGLREDRALRGRRPVRRLSGRRRGLRARELLYTSLGAGYREALESGGPGPRRGRRRGNPRLLDQDRAEQPRCGGVARDVRAGVHPRHAERDAGAHPDRRLRDHGRRLGAARGRRRPRRCPASWAATTPTSSSRTRRHSSRPRSRQGPTSTASRSTPSESCDCPRQTARLQGSASRTGRPAEASTWRSRRRGNPSAPDDDRRCRGYEPPEEALSSRARWPCSAQRARRDDPRFRRGDGDRGGTLPPGPTGTSASGRRRPCLCASARVTWSAPEGGAA